MEEKYKDQDTKIDNDIKQALITEQNTVPYRAMSSLPDLKTVIPLSLLGETLEAQASMRIDVPDIDAYLMQKLNYRSKVALSNAFKAEQADAVAMAIYQIEKEQSLILADMAGIGKGRVCAGVLRYAFSNGYLPVFITEKDNLFSDIYRDILDIGGLGFKNGKPRNGLPFILNGYTSGGYEIDEQGNKIKKASPTSIIDQQTGEVIIEAPKKKEVTEIMENKSLPAKYDMIMMTYSQIAAPKSGAVKFKYLENLFESLDFKVVIIMDECHNASGSKSKTGERMRSMVSSVKGCVFSSATFSKTPENMYLYAAKTDLIKSNVPLDDLLVVIKKGGERLIENMASSLARAGQLIRRERRFDNCNVIYEYMSEAEKADLYYKYDTTMSVFRKMRDYFSNKNPPFADAKRKAILRFCEQKKIEFCDIPKPKNKKEREEWLDENVGKYRLRYFTAGEINRVQFNFVETLLFSLKADFVANLAINQLQNMELENLTVETKEIFKSNRKPVIAVRNTLEGVYNTLGISIGDVLQDGDFIIYVKSLAQGALNGVITLVEITKKDKDEDEDDEEEDEQNVITEEYSVELSDFEDKGKYYLDFLEEIKSMKLNIPVSPIDSVIQQIQAAKRDAKDNNGGGSPTFRVGEVTGRTKRLLKEQDGTYKLYNNPKEKNKASAFKKFNDGFYDVLLINESGSTGASAHSSVRFADQRPRCMIIHQVELDVNTEVQKRGRINRTGMVNYPTYIYAVSRIPSEIRSLLMLVKKLRKLDANITGNQKQSQKLSEIKDGKGKAIEDIINKYGDEVLVTFLDDPAHERYEQYRIPEDQRGRAVLGDELEIEHFMRQLQIASADDQETFFDTVNQLYIQLVAKKIEDKTYDLETEILDLKSSIKNRVVLVQGENTSPFNSSVYAEDNFVIAEDKPMSKAEVEEYMRILSYAKDPVENYNEIVVDFEKEKEKTLASILSDIEVPDYEKAADETQREMMKMKYDAKVFATTEKFNNDQKKITEYFKFFKPDMPCVVPTVPEDCYETDGDGKPVPILYWNNTKFVGIKLSSNAKHKYSPMNIEFVFAQLSGAPRVFFNPTRQGRIVIDNIVEKTRYIERVRIIDINNWQVDKNLRRLTRILTGNIIQAYSTAQDIIRREPDGFAKTIDFIKFTTVEQGSIRYGIRMRLTPYSELDVSQSATLMNLNQEALIDAFFAPKYIKTTNSQQTVKLESDSTINIYLFGGLERSSGGKGKYYSKFYDDPKIAEICKTYDVYYETTTHSYKPFDAQKSQTLKCRNMTVYKGDSTAKFFLKELFDYMYNVIPMKFNIKGVKGDEVVERRGDDFVPESEGQEQPDGIFRYSLLVPYPSISEKLSTFSKFESFEPSGSVNGIVTLKKRATALEATTYDLAPLDSKPNHMLADIFSLLSDSEKIKFRNDIKKAVEDGKTKVEVGILAQAFIKNKVYTLKNIFGAYANYSFIGQLMFDYIEGKQTELPSEEEKEQGQEQQQQETIPLNMETAQDFIILLNSQIT